MAIFKSKAGEGKREVVFHGGHAVATIIDALETEDAKVIDALTSLGYERIDPPIETVGTESIVEPVVKDVVADLPPVPARAKRKLGGK